VSTSNNKPDTEELPIWVTVFIVQTPVSERTDALSCLASMLHISLGSAHSIRIYRTAILHVVLYGCETWSLILKEKRRLRVFENRVLRRIFGPNRDGVMGEWRKFHNEELNGLYSLPNIVQVIK
jgi:hypothetical protein